MKSLTNLSTSLSLAFSILALTAVTGQAATIYKVVDQETGRITFTDRPDSYQQDSRKQVIDTHIATTRPGVSMVEGYSAATAPVAPVNSATNGLGQSLAVNNNLPPELGESMPRSTATRYRLTMTEPASSRAYRRPAQDIVIQLAISPALQTEDQVAIYLDGNEVAQGATVQLPTLDILPGEHQISGKITNEHAGVIAEVSQTIYIIQNTSVLQQKKLKEQQLIEQLKAYQKLPWPQKLYLQLQQKNLPQAAIPKPNNADKSSDDKNTVSQAIGGQGGVVATPVKTSSVFR